MTRRPRWRLVVMMVLSLVATMFLVGRLATIQLVEPDRYIEWGESQRIQTREIAAHRGTIVDRDGDVLAVSLPQTTIWADPRVVQDPLATARALGSVLDVDVDDLAERLAGDGAFAYVERQISDELAAAVASLGLDGVYSYEEHARFNPNGDDLARSVLGRAGLDQEGVSGLELQYGDDLIGTPGRIEAERGNDGATIPGGVYEHVPPVPGSTLTLTIDRSLQHEAERQLVRHVVSTGSERAVALVADPETGELLAMASVIRDEDGAVEPADANLGVTWVYEPGSVMKAVTISGLIEAGAVSPVQWFDLPPSLDIYDHEFVDEHRWGDHLQLHHILANSSNVGTITAARMGDLAPGYESDEALLHDTLTDFGFGERTELDFPGESAGLLAPVEEWSGLSVPNMAIGQGIATTPAQILSSYITIANGGLRRPLSIVSSVDPAGEEGDGEGDEAAGDDSDGTVAGEEGLERVISTETAHTVTGMLTEVVHAEYGTGTEAALPGYTVAGKTGTAWQILEDGTYGYGGNRHYVSSFVGFAPAEDPEVVVYVALDRPDPLDDGTAPNASKVAAPLFADITQFALRRLHVPPVDSGEAVVAIGEERVRATAAPGPTPADGDEGDGDVEPGAEAVEESAWRG